MMFRKNDGQDCIHCIIQLIFTVDNHIIKLNDALQFLAGGSNSQIQAFGSLQFSAR